MIKVLLGDITDLRVDALVNAANNHLWMGSGVAGAIKRKGGAAIEAEAVALGPIPVGEAVVTAGGDLAAKYVIHAASMGQDLCTDVDKVREATKNTLLRAEELNLHSIAFPALGTGVGGLSTLAAAKVMVAESRRHLAAGSCIKEVYFALFAQEAYNDFLQIVKRNKIVCLGDSITYGYPYDPEVSWVRLTSKQLELDMINKGVNGDTTEQMLDRFQTDAAALEPSFIIILGGTNDAFLGVDPVIVQKAVYTMVEQSFNEGICPVLGLPAAMSTEGILAQFPSEDIAAVAGELDTLRNWIRSFAEVQKIPLMDFYSPLLSQDGSQGNSIYFVDGYHPNRAGYQVLSKAAEGLLSRLKSL